MLHNKRRTIIYGAGAIGCALGGHLALSGADVVLIGRPGHVKAIRMNGLRFINPTGTHIVKIEAVTSPDQIEIQPQDVIILTVKSQDTESAMVDLKKVVQDVAVFCLQNGIRNEEMVARYFPRVYGAMIRIGGEYLKDGEVIVRRDPPGWVVMGRYPEGMDSLVESLAFVLRQAGFLVLVTPNVMPYKWGKLMLNLNNAVGAITNAGWGELRAIGQAVMSEAQEILKEAGVRWKSQEVLSREWPEFNQKPRSVLPTTEQSSTWQSLTRRQGTVETEFLNGEIVRLAGRIGRKAPINAALVNITQKMAAERELPGKYSPAELQRMLGIFPNG
jgi:2-dehydropantoate 2-reductase